MLRTNHIPKNRMSVFRSFPVSASNAKSITKNFTSSCIQWTYSKSRSIIGHIDLSIAIRYASISTDSQPNRVARRRKTVTISPFGVPVRIHSTKNCQFYDNQPRIISGCSLKWARCCSFTEQSFTAIRRLLKDSTVWMFWKVHAA